MNFTDLVTAFTVLKEANWITVLSIWVVAQFLNYKVIAKALIHFLKVTLPKPLQKPIFIFLDKLAKQIDKQIPDNK